MSPRTSDETRPQSRASRRTIAKAPVETKPGSVALPEKTDKEADSGSDDRGNAARGFALYGGTFDPIHRGHLEMARAALRCLPVSEVRFTTAGVPPHKAPSDSASADDRHAMVELALADEPRFVADRTELDRPGPSYTIDTLRDLSLRFPGRPVYLLLGSDNARHLAEWHGIREILDLATPVLLPRKGSRAVFAAGDLPFIDARRRSEIGRARIDAELDDTSSTEIRSAVRRGDSIEEWVPPAVARYIEEHGLYRT